jgi:DnaJ-class molecular chaperone
MIIQCELCKSSGEIEYGEDRIKNTCPTCKGNGFINLTEEYEAYGNDCIKGNCDI